MIAVFDGSTAAPGRDAVLTALPGDTRSPRIRSLQIVRFPVKVSARACPGRHNRYFSPDRNRSAANPGAPFVYSFWQVDYSQKTGTLHGSPRSRPWQNPAADFFFLATT
jgi:hypothetical protein